jgi:7-carboxy-7-deazaguanine synthase
LRPPRPVHPALRLHLSCGWCDSPYTHDATRFDLNVEHSITTIEDILTWLDNGPPGLVVITGGEPLLQPQALARLTTAIRDAGLATDIEIETSGTIAPTVDLSDAVTRFNVSPKLAHSGLRHHQRIRPAVLDGFATSGKATFKFVVQAVRDLAEIDELVTAHGLDPVWVMPEGTDSATVLARMRELATPVLDRGWHLSTRLHVLLWENTRAR